MDSDRRHIIEDPKENVDDPRGGIEDPQGVVSFQTASETTGTGDMFPLTLPTEAGLRSLLIWCENRSCARRVHLGTLGVGRN